jgi:hypothetical protein
LRAVIAFDDHEIALGMRTAERNKAYIFRRIIAGDRRLIIPELDHHIAGPRRTFLGNVAAAAHQKMAAVFREYRAVLRDIFFVAIGIVHIDARDPVAFCHLRSPS